MGLTFARQAFSNIMAQIDAFQENLDDDKEVAVLLASFGSSLLMTVTGIGFQKDVYKRQVFSCTD